MTSESNEIAIAAERKYAAIEQKTWEHYFGQVKLYGMPNELTLRQERDAIMRQASEQLKLDIQNK